LQQLQPEHQKDGVEPILTVLHSRVTTNGNTNGSSNSTSSKARNVVENQKADENLEQLAAKGIPPAAAAPGAEGGGKAAEADGSPVLTREEVVHEFFSYLFPDTFQLALPVLRHKVPHTMQCSTESHLATALPCHASSARVSTLLHVRRAEAVGAGRHI
jgi:hypothetical protein